MPDFKIFRSPEGVLTAEVLTPSEGALVWLRVVRGPGGVSISSPAGSMYSGRGWPTTLRDARVWTSLGAFRADPEGTPLSALFKALDAADGSLAADLERILAELRALEDGCGLGGSSLARARQILASFRAGLDGARE